MPERNNKPPPEENDTETFRLALQELGHQKYVLRLYVSGATPNSQRAINNVRKICEEHLHGRYELEIIDIFQEPVLAKEQQIIAVPTLVKELPTPLRKFIGDMSKIEKILIGLDLQPAEE